MMTPNRIMMAAALALGAGLFLAGTEANACGNGEVIFEDKFATLDPGWGLASELNWVENGALMFKAPKFQTWAISESDFYEDVAICVDATVTSLVDKTMGYTGIVFWQEDKQNYYEYGYWPEAGGIRVDRVKFGKRLYPMPETDTPALKKGVGQTNSLELETKGNKVRLYVNGTKVGEFNGKSPEGGGRVGLFTSHSNGETVAKFKNFVIAKPRSGPVSLR